MPELKIGLFGGSFDPIHKGHIAVAEYMLDYLQLDKIFFIPSLLSFENKHYIASDVQRIAMCNLTAKINSKFSCSDFEIQNNQSNYTVHTAAYFRSKFPDAIIYWILGADQAIHFSKWHQPEEILALINLAVYPRDNIQLPRAFNVKSHDIEAIDHPTNKKYGAIVYCDKAPQLKYQSSHIKKQPHLIKGQVPLNILQYIQNNHLYEN